MFIRRIAHWAFEQLNAGQYEALLDRCAPQVQHTFAGYALCPTAGTLRRE